MSDAGVELHRCVCTMSHGLDDTPIIFPDEESFFRHLERDHHILVARLYETPAAALDRFVTQYPVVTICPRCRSLRAIWCTPVPARRHEGRRLKRALPSVELRQRARA